MISDFHGRLDLARRYADALVGPSVVGILLVGSVARGHFTHDSDLDLAVLKDGPIASMHRHDRSGTIPIGIEELSYNGLLALAQARYLSLSDLRQSGRISNAIVLYATDDRISFLLEVSARTALNPKAAGSLLATALEALHTGRRSRSPAARLLLLQGAVAALTTLRLARSRWRYQKPKWVFRDLRALRDRSLLSAIRTAFRLGDAKRSVAMRLRDAFMDAAKVGLALAGLPPLTRLRRASYEYIYTRRTMMDAESLLADRDYEAACYTIWCTFRLLATLLEGKRNVTSSQLRKWRHSALQSLVGGVWRSTDGDTQLGDLGALWQREALAVVR